MLIESFILLFSISFTVLITYFAIPVGKGYHYFAPILLLIAGYLLGVALVWIILTIFALPYDKNKKYEKPSKWANFWLTEAVTYIDDHAGARLIKTINKPLPKERYLLVCNHRSKFDPMLLTKLYGHKELAFISKPTNFKIPLGGHFMKATCYLSIDRFDKLKSLEVMKEASDLICKDLTSIGVFPEGTRNDDGELHPFHEGVFNIALRSNCPIVVTSMDGTENIHHNFPFKRTKIKYQVIDVIYPSDYNGMVAKEISDKVYEMMKESLQK